MWVGPPLAVVPGTTARVAGPTVYKNRDPVQLGAYAGLDKMVDSLEATCYGMLLTFHTAVFV